MVTAIIDGWCAAAGLWFVKTTCLLGMALVIVAIARRASPAIKHTILATGMFGVLLLPLYSPALPQWHIDLKPAVADLRPNPPEVAEPVRATPSHSGISSKAANVSGKLISTETGHGDTASIMSTPMVPAGIDYHRTPSALAVVKAKLFFVWLVGVACFLLRLIASHRRLRAVVDSASTFPSEMIERDLAPSSGRLWRVLSSTAISVPLTAGWRRPVIVLPDEAVYWPQSRLRTVLLHEMAHIRRGDWCFEMMSQLSCCVYWPQPLVWLTAKRMRLEAEFACDDTVIMGGVGATTYATDLLEVARGCANREQVPKAGLAMASKSTLEARLREMVNPARRRKALPRALLLLTAVVLVAGFLPVAAITMKRSAAQSTGGVTVAPAGNQPAVTLPSGITVQLQGLTSAAYSVMGEYWWDANGRTIPQPSENGDRFHQRLGFGFNERYKPRILSFKLTSPKAVDASTTGEIVGMTGMVGGTGFVGTDLRLNDAVLRPNVPSFGRISVGFSKPGRRFSYRVGVATDPWKTVLSVAPPFKPSPSDVVEADMPNGDIAAGIWLDLHESPEIGYQDKSKRVHNVYLLPKGKTLNHEARRVILLDRDGHTVPIHTFTNVLDADPFYAIRAVDFQHVARIVIQTRPYEWAEFRDIAMDRIPTASAPADAVPIPAPATLPAYRVNLDGAGIDLIAVSSPPGQGNRWWLPNGKPLAGPIKGERYQDLPSIAGKKGRWLTFKIWALKPANVSYSVRVVDSNGKALWNWGDNQSVGPNQPGGFGACVAVPTDTTTGRVHIDASAGAWKTLAELPLRQSAIRHHVVTKDRDYTADIMIHTGSSPDLEYFDRFGRLIKIPFIKGGAPLPQTEASQVVAIMRNGKTKQLQWGAMDAHGRVIQLAFDPKSYLTYYNNGLNPAEIKSFALQTRPMQAFELADVALDPAK